MSKKEYCFQCRNSRYVKVDAFKQKDWIEDKVCLTCTYMGAIRLHKLHLIGECKLFMPENMNENV